MGRTICTNKIQVAVLIAVLCVLFPITNLLANEDDKISRQIADIKHSMIELGSDVKAIEKLLLYSEESLISVYLSMDAGQLFELNNVKLIIDDKQVTSQQYADREKRGFQKGAAQLLYKAEIAPGKHELVAVFSGTGVRNRPMKRGLTYKVNKTKQHSILEIVIKDDVSKQRPMFVVRQIE